MKLKQEIRQLQSLYDLLPQADIACVEGCSKCCGPVPATRAELRRAPRLGEVNTDLQALTWALINQGDCGNCPYIEATGSGCAIYEGRPFLCRLFGLIEDEPKLQCSYGPRTTRPLSATQGRMLLDRYLKIFTGSGETAQLEENRANWMALRDKGFV